MRKIITVGEVKKLLKDGKTVKVKTINDEFTKITKYWEKGILNTYRVILEDDLEIKTSKNHKFFSLSGWIETKDLVVNETAILCEDGKYRKILSKDLIGKQKIVDITVEHPQHCYFGNKILNHNSGKSYMAAQIAAQAQKKGIHIVYFDSESSVDPEFLEKIGVDLQNFTYVQATSVEFVFKTIEEILANSDGIRYLFIWDSFANTPSESDLEDDQFNPQSSMAKIPRIATLGMRKLTVPIANAESTLLVLNQLKTNIGDPGMTKIEPWFTPGGKALQYAYSLRIWLTKRKAKDSYVVNDENGFRVGSEVKVKLHKSRFGTEGRECWFKIVWGADPVGIQDEDSWLDAIRGSERLKTLGAWKALVMNDGSEVKFQEANWREKLNDSKFLESVMTIIQEEVIQKFDKKVGSASSFYNIEESEE